MPLTSEVGACFLLQKLNSETNNFLHFSNWHDALSISTEQHEIQAVGPRNFQISTLKSRKQSCLYACSYAWKAKQHTKRTNNNVAVRVS
jgi:hypothetical protein